MLKRKQLAKNEANKLQKKPSKNAHKRREYNMIDLTLNHHEIDEESDLNFTITDGSLPPLRRSSQNVSLNGDEEDNHERYSRSHKRERKPQALISKQYQNYRKTEHRKDESNDFSLNISGNAISLETGNVSNNRSDLLHLQKELSYDKTNNINKGSRISKNTSLTSHAKVALDKEKFSKVKHNLKLRKFSKSDKKAIFKTKPEDSRSGSRKSRLLSKTSSKSKINLEEFSKLKFENERYKHVLAEILSKFHNFKVKMSQANLQSSESGSSVVWRDKYSVNAKTEAEPNMINIDIPGESEKDILIAKMKKQLLEKDRIINDLRSQLDMKTEK